MTDKTLQLTAGIIDDEILSAKLLEKLIQDYIPEVAVTCICTDPADAIRQLKEKQVDLIFLDMDMPEIKGLELLKMMPAGTEKHVICVTGHENFAIEALRMGVQDYLVKPVTASMLREAMDQYLKKRENPDTNIRLDLSGKLFINRQDRAFIVNVDDILFLEAEGPYTIFHMVDKEVIKSSKSLGYYKKVLENKLNLVAVHRSYILNFSHIKEIIKDDDGEGLVIMSNGQNLEFSNVSKNRLIQFIQEVLSGNMPA